MELTAQQKQLIETVQNNVKTAHQNLVNVFTGLPFERGLPFQQALIKLDEFMFRSGMCNIIDNTGTVEEASEELAERVQEAWNAVIEDAVADEAVSQEQADEVNTEADRNRDVTEAQRVV